MGVDRNGWDLGPWDWEREGDSPGPYIPNFSYAIYPVYSQAYGTLNQKINGWGLGRFEGCSWPEVYHDRQEACQRLRTLNAWVEQDWATSDRMIRGFEMRRQKC